MFTSVVSPTMFAAVALVVSYACFFYVLYMQWRMISSAMAETDDAHARKW